MQIFSPSQKSEGETAKTIFGAFLLPKLPPFFLRPIIRRVENCGEKAKKDAGERRTRVFVRRSPNCPFQSIQLASARARFCPSAAATAVALKTRVTCKSVRTPSFLPSFSPSALSHYLVTLIRTAAGADRKTRSGAACNVAVGRASISPFRLFCPRGLPDMMSQKFRLF